MVKSNITNWNTLREVRRMSAYEFSNKSNLATCGKTKTKTYKHNGNTKSITKWKLHADL